MRKKYNSILLVNAETDNLTDHEKTEILKMINGGFVCAWDALEPKTYSVIIGDGSGWYIVRISKKKRFRLP